MLRSVLGANLRALTSRWHCGNACFMTELAFKHRIYAPDEILADAVVHGVAIIAAAFGSFSLFRHGIPGGGPKLAALVIYLLALLTMLGASAAYNLTPVSPLKWLLRRFDHSVIYVMIAGTYTPLLVQLQNADLALLLGAIVWLGAGVGVVLKVLMPGRYDGLAVIAYLALGWVGIFALPSFIAVLPKITMVFIVVGGLLYTAGVPFYLWEKLKFQNVIWHMFVVAAAAAHFMAIASLYV
jgi:hemolysin III